MQMHKRASATGRQARSRAAALAAPMVLRAPNAVQPVGRRAAPSHDPQPRLMSLARAQATDEVVLEEIDPVTGMPIAKTASSNPVAGFEVQVQGRKWAYRRSEITPGEAKDLPAVLLIHGLGSSSYSWRNTLGLLGADGIDAIAPDWLGHGDSDKPTSGFDYSEASFVAALDAFVEAVGIKKPLALVVQGSVLSQYALQWALQNESKVARLMILNTPLSKDCKLRPELAAYKTPLAFMRPKTFEGDLFNAAGSPYMMDRKTADAYARPYLTDPAAAAAVASTMDKVDFGKLISKVNEGFFTWRKPTIVLFGSRDTFVGNPFDFVEDKRTNIKVVTAAARLGHMPQEDFAEAVHESMLPWVRAESDGWTPGKLMKMTKGGGVESGRSA